MSDRTLEEGDDLHSDASREGHAKAMEAERSVVVKPFEQVSSDSRRKEEEFDLEVDIPSTEGGQYFSTPMPRRCKQSASTIVDPQENLLGYKSFFNLECDAIIHQLQSKAAQGWSASKRKLEEMDISTIEAEPPPLPYYTPKSVWNETTRSSKRRKIDSEGHEGNFSLNTCLTKPNSPSLGTSRVRGLEKIYGLNPCKNSTQEKSNPGFNFESHTKHSLFLKKSRTAHPQSNNLPANSQESVPAELPSGTCLPLLYHRTRSKINFHHESPRPDLEFRSFFAAECEKICNQLMRHDKEKMLGDVSSIEAEPPPGLSATINSTVILEQGSTCKENSAMGVSQLDLEKMNIKYPISERPFVLQKTPGTGLRTGNAIGPKENVMTIDPAKVYEVVCLANTSQDINKEESADGAFQEIRIVHNQFPILDIARSIPMIEANTIQGITKMHNSMPLADDPQGNVGMCEDLAKVLDKVPVTNVTRDITMCDDVTEVREVGAQVIVAEGDTSAMNALQHNLTSIKMPSSKDPTGTEISAVSLANDIPDIIALCNEAPAVQAIQNIRTACREKSAANASPEMMRMFNEVCVASGIQEMRSTEKLSEVNVTVDIGTIFSKGMDSEDRDTNILQRNIVTDAPLKNVTLIKSDANVVNDFQKTYSEVTSDGAINKTFTCCKVTEPNVTHDLSSVNRGTVTNHVQDLTQLISYKDAAYIPLDISIIDGKPKMNVTRTLMSICNRVTTTNDSLQGRDDLTKIIATNCTLLDDPSKNGSKPPGRQSRPMWPMAALARASSRNGSMSNLKDCTYNLDLTDIANDESVFFNRPTSFITSTPLPSLGNPMVIKKSCGLPMNLKPRVFGTEQENPNKVISAQGAAMSAMPFTGRPLIADPRTKGGIAQGVGFPNPSKDSIPKVIKSSVPQPKCRIPAPRSTSAPTVLKTPQVAKAAVTRKDQLPLDGTYMKPRMASTNLPRKSTQYGQTFKSGTSSSIQRQQMPVNCIRTGKEIFKKRTDVPKFPASSLGRPPLGPSTAACQMKIQGTSGLQSTAHARKVSATGLPIRKSQEALIKPRTK